MLAEQPDPRVRTYVVWVPELNGTETDVPVATRLIPDPRATHYWDSAGALVRSYARVLELGQNAWDVYFLYGPEARWDGERPPTPYFWMHQLATTRGPHFDPRIFADSMNAMLKRR